MAEFANYHSRHTGQEIDDAVDRIDAISGSPMASGFIDLQTGINGDVVEGLNLSFTPTKAFLQVESPDGGLIMFAVFLRDSLSYDGFTFRLSGTTDSIYYRLHYLLVGDAGGDSSGANESNES